VGGVPTSTSERLSLLVRPLRMSPDPGSGGVRGGVAARPCARATFTCGDDTGEGGGRCAGVWLIGQEAGESALEEDHNGQAQETGRGMSRRECLLTRAGATCDTPDTSTTECPAALQLRAPQLGPSSMSNGAGWLYLCSHELLRCATGAACRVPTVSQIFLR
jgi:hypothetical protein